MIGELVAEKPQFLQLRLRFGESRFGDCYDTAACFFAVASQAHDSFDFIEAETERLRFADERYLFQRSIVIHTITARRSRWLREEPAPLVKADGIGLHSRKLCQPPNQ